MEFGMEPFWFIEGKGGGWWTQGRRAAAEDSVQLQLRLFAGAMDVAGSARNFLIQYFGGFGGSYFFLLLET